MKTILVTGGAGFLGSSFVRGWLAEEVSRVVVLDKLTYAGSLESLASVRNDRRFEFHQGDIGDGPLMASLLAEIQPWAIVNFAAETHVDRSIDAPAPFIATNVVGTCQLLEAALGHWLRLGEADQVAFRFLHLSTDEVFGSMAAGEQATEASPYRPSSPYAASKAAADHLVQSYHRTFGLPTLIVHPTNCYGPYQFPEKLIPLVILNAMEGKQLPIYGDGTQQRDWLFVEDANRAIRLAMNLARPGQTLNIAGGNEQTNLALVNALCKLVDRLLPGLPHLPCESLISHVADRPGHDQRYALDTTKIGQSGWKAQTDLKSGLEKTVRWYAEHQDWVEQVAGSYDRTERQGEGRR